MKHENRENSDDLTVKLLRAAALPVEQVDEIANAPHLLRSVCARIEAEKLAIKKDENSFVPTKTANEFWQQLFNFRRLIGIVAAVFAVAVLVWQVGISRQQNFAPSDNFAQNNFADAANHMIKPNDFAIINEPKLPTVEIAKQTQTSVKPVKVSTKLIAAPIIKSKKQFAATRTERVKLKQVQTSSREFYQLALAGELNANETKQIVRVKLSPDALNTLGVGAPASAQPNKAITADLLLGEDGTPRAIRFVK